MESLATQNFPPSWQRCKKFVMTLGSRLLPMTRSVQQSSRRRRRRDFSGSRHRDCFVKLARVVFAAVAAQTGGVARDGTGLVAGLCRGRRPAVAHRGTAALALALAKEWSGESHWNARTSRRRRFANVIPRPRSRFTLQPPNSGSMACGGAVKEDRHLACLQFLKK